MRRLVLVLPLALLAAPAAAQLQHPPRRTVANLGTCAASGVGGPRFVIVTDGASSTDCATGGGATTVPCWCNGSTWTVLTGSGGSGDVTDVGDCSTGACFQAVGATAFFAGPAGGGVAAFRVIAEADIPATIARDSELHTEDHAARHSLGGADPVTVTNLASGCTDAQVLGGTAAGTGVECQSDAIGTDDQVAAEVPFTPAGGVAATDVQAAIEEVDAEHTVDTDTTCLDAGVACLFAASATEGGAATAATALAANGANCGAGEWAAGVDASGAAEGCTTDATLSGASAGGDLSGTYPNPSLAADTVGLAELAACAGPDEIVEYGASGVPSCIATPSGGGGSGDVVGPASATDNAVARYDLTTGKLLQNSGLIVGDTGIVSLAGGAAFHLQNSSAANRLYVDDFDSRIYHQGAEVARIGLTAQLRSDMHLLWSSTTSPTGTKDVGAVRSAAGVLRVSNGSTGNGSILALMAQLAPQASAPTCPASSAGLYFDSSGSGALCACPPGGAWSILFDFGSGNCT